MRSFIKESEFVNLCRDVMTGNVVISQQAFFLKVVKILFPRMDPITKKILTENVSKLYTFLTSMSSHPMRVPLSHAMTSTFLDTIRVDGDDISKMLAKHNTEYTIDLNEEAVTQDIKTANCPYDDYLTHILGNVNRTKGTGRIKVVLIYGDVESKQTTAQGVEFKLNIPFKTVSKTMYVDITGITNRSKGKTTCVFVKSKLGFKFVNAPNDKIFSVDTTIGETLTEYYKMWRVKEKFLAKVYSKFVGETVCLHFTYEDSRVSYY